MQAKFRRATLEDAEAISKIWKVVCSERIYTAVNRPFTPQQLQEYILNLSDREGIFLAEVNSSIVGFQSLDLWGKYTDSFDHVGVLGTFFRPEWRKKGIGSRLAKHTFEFARANGYEKLLIYVRSGNEGAKKFYQNLDFVPKGVLLRQVKIDGQYEDEIFMELFL